SVRAYRPHIVFSPPRVFRYSPRRRRSGSPAIYAPWGRIGGMVTHSIVMHNNDRQEHRMEQEACSIALYDGRAVLLVQRARAPFAGFWTLPGGRIELGESPEDAVCREVWEELGLIAPAPVPILTKSIADEKRKYRLKV